MRADDGHVAVIRDPGQGGAEGDGVRGRPTDDAVARVERGDRQQERGVVGRALDDRVELVGDDGEVRADPVGLVGEHRAGAFHGGRAPIDLAVVEIDAREPAGRDLVAADEGLEGDARAAIALEDHRLHEHIARVGEHHRELLLGRRRAERAGVLVVEVYREVVAPHVAPLARGDLACVDARSCAASLARGALELQRRGLAGGVAGPHFLPATEGPAGLAGGASDAEGADVLLAAALREDALTRGADEDVASPALDRSFATRRRSAVASRVPGPAGARVVAGREEEEGDQDRQACHGANASQGPRGCPLRVVRSSSAKNCVEWRGERRDPHPGDHRGDPPPPPPGRWR